MRYSVGWKLQLGFVILCLVGVCVPNSVMVGLVFDVQSEVGVRQLDAPLYVTWHRTFGTEGEDYGRDLLPLSDGGLMLVGKKSTGGSSGDVWLVQVGPNGQHKWDQSYGDPRSLEHADELPWAAVQCADEGYAIVATHHISTALDATAASTLLLRLDRYGNQLWNQSYRYLMWDMCKDLVECADGGFLLAGFVWYNPFFVAHPPPRNEAWLLRTDAYGNVLWNYTFGDYTDEFDGAMSIVECAGGGFAFTGSVYNTVDSQQENDVWLVRIADNGTMVWQTTFGGRGYDTGYNLIQSKDRGFVIVGMMEDIATNTTDAYLLRTDVNGTLLWSQTFGAEWDDQAYSLVEMPNGNLAITGYVGVSETDWDLLFWLTDADGAHLTNLTFGGSYGEYGYQLVPKRTGGFFITGSTQSYGSGGSDLLLLLVSEEPQVHNGTPPPILPYYLIGLGIIVIVLPVMIGLFFMRKRDTKTIK